MYNKKYELIDEREATGEEVRYMAISEKPSTERKSLLIHGFNQLTKPRRSVPPSQDQKGEHDCVFQPEETRLPEDPQIPALDKDGLPLCDGEGELIFIHPPREKGASSGKV